MKRIPTHTIRHTYINRFGQVRTRVNCTAHGSTHAEARDLFAGHVRFAENAWASQETKSPHVWNGVPVRILGIQLVDANGTELAAWAHKVEMAVAS